MNLLTAAPDEAAAIIARAVASARDLLSLAIACRRFAVKCIAARPLALSHRTATSGGGTAACPPLTTQSSVSEFQSIQPHRGSLPHSSAQASQESACTGGPSSPPPV
jgi:hypothetical protein